MFLKYMNKGIQLVKTKEWKREVKEWEIFEAYDNDWASWLKSYKWMFEQVENIGNTVEKNEKKENKKKWNKIIKK